MSNMKHDAVVQSGIKILERIPIPEDMIPNDSRVEIDAKINAGYFTTGKQYTKEELAAVRGRGWEKWEDVTVGLCPEQWTWLTMTSSTNYPHVWLGGKWMYCVVCSRLLPGLVSFLDCSLMHVESS